jgi:hypothetical protein
MAFRHPRPEYAARVRRPIATLVIALSVAAGPAVASAPAAQKTWKPDFAAAQDYAKHRRGIIGFALRTEHHLWGYHETRTMPSASVVKAMILVAYLDLPSVSKRALNSQDRGRLSPMIRRSSDAATNDTFYYVGFKRLRQLAKRVGMVRFKTVHTHWGRSHIDASDQSKFFLHIDDFIVARHRAYAMKLLASVVPSQRWGIAQVQPPGWQLFFKGGWGAGTGWVDHQAALLRRGSMRVSLAILTHWDPSHDYGKQTIRKLAARLLRGLGPNSVVQ